VLTAVNMPHSRKGQGTWVEDVVTASHKNLWDVVTTSTRTGAMPSSSNHFIGRTDHLAKLEAVFTEGRSQPDICPVSVLSGLGGIGKTQLSVKFAETRAHL
jgi:uncharacterized protein (DUF39 family)